MKDKVLFTELIDLGDERGGLNVVEGGKQIPFEIKRIFYDYKTDPLWVRGNHANRNSRFAFISVSGRCVVETDDGFTKKAYDLDSPNKMLIIDKMIWKIMKDFSEDNVLLVLSDHCYDKEEYITDYNAFLVEVNR